MDAKTPDFNSGYLRIYDGAQPAGPGTALSGQTLLAELRFNASAFGAAVAGVATAAAIVSGVGLAVGTAAWYRCLKPDGTTALHDGTVGTAASNCIIATTSIVVAVAVACSAFTLTEAATSSQ